MPDRRATATTPAQALAADAASATAVRVDTHGHARSSRAEGGSLVRLAAPGILIGAGLGGLMDGFLFHRLLQWHHVTSGPFEPGHTALENSPEQLIADGVLDLCATAAIVVALVLIWAAGHHAHSLWRYAGASLVGWSMAGWAAYNTLGLCLPAFAFDRHHLNVIGGGQLGWDVAWLGISLVVGAIGLGLAMQGRPRDTARDYWAG